MSLLDEIAFTTPDLVMPMIPDASSIEIGL
jgi:hypothetical protein